MHTSQKKKPSAAAEKFAHSCTGCTGSVASVAGVHVSEVLSLSSVSSGALSGTSLGRLFRNQLKTGAAVLSFDHTAFLLRYHKTGSTTDLKGLLLFSLSDCRFGSVCLVLQRLPYFVFPSLSFLHFSASTNLDYYSS